MDIKELTFFWFLLDFALINAFVLSSLFSPSCLSYVQKHTSVFYLAVSILILMFLPIFYLIVFLYQRYTDTVYEIRISEGIFIKMLEGTNLNSCGIHCREMRKGTTQLKRISRPGKKTKPS